MLDSVRVFVCLLRERSALESGEGIIVYSIYLRLRRPTTGALPAVRRADHTARDRWIVSRAGRRNCLAKPVLYLEIYLQLLR